MFDQLIKQPVLPVELKAALEIVIHSFLATVA